MIPHCILDFLLASPGDIPMLPLLRISRWGSNMSKAMAFPSNILPSMSEYLSDLRDLYRGPPASPRCPTPALPRPSAGIRPAFLLPQPARGRSQDFLSLHSGGNQSQISSQLDRQMDNLSTHPIGSVSLMNPIHYLFTTILLTSKA